ncbi:MAG: hypothetical protein ABIQ40_14475 [Bacteroidia bacterium]
MIEALILMTHPFMMWLYFRVTNLEFEAQKREYIAQQGSAEGLYGDCSGASFILPILICAYMIFFLLGSLIMFSLYKEVSRTLIVVSFWLIFGAAIVPSLILDIMLIMRL